MMSDRDVIKNYIDEHYSNLYPKYYDMNKEYLMEYSWIHFACEEILQYLALLSGVTASDVLKILEQEAAQCYQISIRKKDRKAKMIFETELNIVKELIKII